MNTNEIDLDSLEASWDKPAPDVTHDEDPATELSVKAHSIFIDDQQAIDALACRIADQGITTVTASNYTETKTLIATCRTARGRIEKLRKSLNADALAWTRCVNAKAGELTRMIESFELPLKAGIKAIDDEKERLKRAKEEVERQAIIDAENARLEAERIKEAEQRRAEAEANRKEQERLMADRKALEDERKRLADEQAEKDRIAKIERDQLNAELQKKLDAERAAFELERKQANEAKLANEQRIQKDLAERKRVEDERSAKQQAEMAKIEDELAAFRRAKFAKEQEEKRADEAEAKRVAKVVADKLEAERLARLAPDKDKLHGFAKYISNAVNAYWVGGHPQLVSDEAKSLLQRAVMDLNGIVADLQRFGTPTA